MRLRGVLCLVVVPLAAASVHAERLPIRTYTTADGLAHNEIHRIVRDSRGFLWFCTRDGLSRFDGYAFTNFGIEQGLPSANVSDLLETRSGEYWVATSRGLVRFDPAASAMFSVVSPDDEDARARAVTRILEARDGTIWCATERGLQRLEHSGTRTFLRTFDIGAPRERPEQRYIYDLIQARDGSLWLAASSGVYHRLADGSTRRYVIAPIMQGTQAVFEDRDGGLWAATPLAGFYRFTLDAEHDRLVVATHFSTASGFPTDWIYGFLQRADGRMSVGTTMGLIEFSEPPRASSASFRVYTKRNGLSWPEIAAMAEDPSGNLWLGTNEGGAMKLVRDGILTYDTADGVLEASSLAEDSTSALCLRGTLPSLDVIAGQRRLVDDNSTFVPRYGRLDGSSFDWFLPATTTRAADLGWVGDRVVVRSRSGEWWLGTGAGVLRFPAVSSCSEIRGTRPIARYGLESGLAALQVFSLFEDSQGGMWVSTTAVEKSGFSRWDRSTGTWLDVAREAGLPQLQNDLARAFGEDQSGTIWIGYGDRLLRYRKGHFDSFGEKNGLSVGAVTAIDIDRMGHVWLGTTTRGVIRVEEQQAEYPRFRAYTMKEGLSSNSAVVLTHDLLGRLYVGTGRGLDRLDPATGSVKHFTTVDGLASGQFRAALRDHDGVLWFGSTGGLSRLVPAADPPAIPPNVLLTHLSVAGSNRPVSALGEREITLADLQPGQDSLALQFVGLEFGAGEVVQYSYRLDGAPNADWSAPSTDRSLTLGHLAPAAYRLQVRAVNSQAAAGAPAVISFTILKPIWLRWWFMLLAATAVALAAWSWHRQQVSRQVELANVRARIAMDLHDDLGANLTKISILSEVARRQYEAKDGPPGALADIGVIARESVTAMGDIVWAINPQREMLDDLVGRMRLHAEELCASHSLALVFRAPDDSAAIKLTADVRRDLFLIYKEALNNVARHGRGRSVDVSLSVDDQSLRLVVADDGVGFDPNRPDEGHGLWSMRRRADSRGGTCQIFSTVGRGTTVAVALPLAWARQ